MGSPMLRDNNFDLIRLLAAIQVMLMHAVFWLEIPLPPTVMEVMDWFPGVPIFFFVSGYLIVSSFARSPSAVEFLRNRAIRIFPGLWVCLCVSFALVAIQGRLAESSLVPKTLVWLFANGTIFQFAGAVGTGVANGALWSISTELQFYLLVPLIWIFFARRIESLLYCSFFIIVMIILSGFAHTWVLHQGDSLHPWLYQALYSSIFANGYFFLFGVLAYCWRGRLLELTCGRGILFLSLYVALRCALAVAGHSANSVHSSNLSIFVYPFLTLAIFSVAHSLPGLARGLLKGNDFSYGIYIYHMPIIYAFIHYEWFGGGGFVGAAILVLICAVISWFFIEKPILKYKNYSALQWKNLASNGKARHEVF